MADDRDPEVAVEEMAAELVRCEAPLTFVLRPMTALSLAALLDLALRHPLVALLPEQEQATANAKMFIRHVREYFVDHGAVSVVETMDGGTLGGSTRRGPAGS